MPKEEARTKIATGLGVTLTKLEEEFLASRNQRLQEEAEGARSLKTAAQPLPEDPFQRALDEGLDNIRSELKKLFLLAADPKRSRS